MATLTMPQLGETVTEGTVLRWLKQPNDHIDLDEPLVEIDTEKVNVEIPSPFAGTLAAILVPEGETVPVGTPLAEIAGAEEAAPAAPAPTAKLAPKPAAPPPPQAPPITSKAAPKTAPKTAVRPGGDRPRVLSPVVARLAAEHGIDPATLAGTGAGGRVTKKDVLAAIETGPAAAPAPAPAAAQRAGDVATPLSPMRRAIAEHMLRSKRSAPHAWLVIETDVTGLVRARQALKDSFREREGVDLSYLAFVSKVVTQALRDFPPINSTWDGDQLYERGDVNLGFAVDVPDGLIVPVVKQADRMSVAALAHAIADVAARARAGRLKLDEVQGGTFTIDNTGTFGTTLSAPIINQPQVAILTTEAIVKRPVVVDDDAIAVRSMQNLCCSFDHRALDGAIAARFTARVKALLEAIGPDTAIY